MSSHITVMDKVHELLEQHQKENPDTVLVLFAVEFLPEGFPASKTCKISGSPATSIAGLKIMEDMIKESYQDINDRIKSASSIIEAGNRASKMQKLMDAIEENKYNETEIMNLLNRAMEDSDTPDELKSLISGFKKKFGK